MKRQVVMFDVDGVLANFSLGFRTLARELGVAVEPYGHTDPRNTSWDWPDITGQDLKRAWDVVKESGDFWYSLEPLIDECEKDRLLLLHRAHDVYFVTSRVGRRVLEQTTAWLEAELGLAAPSVIVSPRKGEAARALCADYSIEDKPGNAVYIAYHTEGATKSYIIDRPYNQFPHHVLGSKVRRVETVREFLDDVEAGR